MDHRNGQLNVRVSEAYLQQPKIFHSDELIRWVGFVMPSQTCNSRGPTDLTEGRINIVYSVGWWHFEIKSFVYTNKRNLVLVTLNEL